MEDKEIGYIKEKLQIGRPVQHIEIKRLVEMIEQLKANQPVKCQECIYRFKCNQEVLMESGKRVVDSCSCGKRNEG